VNRAMKTVKLVAMAFLFAASTFAQNDVPTFRVNAASALVWNSDSPENASASLVWDPLTGREIHRLSSGGVEVSSMIGFERISSSKEGSLLNYTTTIANNTDSYVSVHYGGASVDGRAAPPLWVGPTNKGVEKRDRKEFWELSKMYCFQGGFSSKENYFSAHELSKIFTIRPGTAKTISSVTTDPRHSALLCSVDGCHITGTIRYYITVNRKDYVFVWPGQSVVYCGE
jgi:hypothetical protein